jgi:hypothetical protein
MKTRIIKKPSTDAFWVEILLFLIIGSQALKYFLLAVIFSVCGPSSENITHSVEAQA